MAATNGILYKHVIGRLHDYPIPEIRLADGQGENLHHGNGYHNFLNDA